MSLPLRRHELLRRVHSPSSSQAHANFYAKLCVFTRDPPVAVASHLSHNLAVDFVLQGVVLGGRTKDLVSQLYRVASVMGVVAHIPQDRWQEKVKEQSKILDYIFKRRSFLHGAHVDVGKDANGKTTDQNGAGWWIWNNKE